MSQSLYKYIYREREKEDPHTHLEVWFVSITCQNFTCSLLLFHVFTEKIDGLMFSENKLLHSSEKGKEKKKKRKGKTSNNFRKPYLPTLGTFLIQQYKYQSLQLSIV